MAELRAAASTRLSNRIGTNRLNLLEQHELGQAIVSDLLNERASAELAVGAVPWDRAYQTRIGQAVYDALFLLGRLQPLVDDETIENIIINGADEVWIETFDGLVKRGPAVAESDQELIDFLSFIAARSQANERSFSPANPRLHLRLDSGARLAAAAWVTPRPAVVIRRHRLSEVDLDDLVHRHTLSQLAADFLTAAVRRRASIVVSGAQGAGKTTLMRALCAAIDPQEVLGTFETEYELGLHLLPERHRVVYAWEARPGSGESDASGHGAGEFLLDDALYDSFRFNLSRQIVGEVRGREILAMIKAMQSGSGSLSTTHASSAEGAIRKLITCALEAGPHVTSAYATRAIAESIDFVVHMRVGTVRGKDGRHRRQRWVDEILAVESSDSPRGFSTTRLFATKPGQTMAALEVVPPQYADVLPTNLSDPGPMGPYRGRPDPHDGDPEVPWW
ncbi:MAG: CpaF/VirB11 family protein [Propionibacteriaceae bacterium]|nr:CpaF/VirB11 family protein [Propionibacteriaceae bacterium]